MIAFDMAVLDAERRRCAAMTAADVVTLDALLLDELHWVHGSGRADTKAALLADIAQNAPYETVEILQNDVAVHGDVAIASGTVFIRTAGGGYTNRFLDIWLRRHDAVGLLASQSTRMPALAP